MLGSDTGIADIKFPGGPELVDSILNNYIGEIYLCKAKRIHNEIQNDQNQNRFYGSKFHLESLLVECVQFLRPGPLES